LITHLKSTLVAVTFLLCYFICFSNTNPIASSVYIPLQDDDFVFLDTDVQSSPIVIESHKLIFFPVPKVADIMFMMLLRRMTGFENWKSLNVDPRDDGLVRLSDYSIEQATEMITSPEYTRATFLRDPKDRFLSTYLDLVLNRNTSIEQLCCRKDDKCFHKYHATIRDFATTLIWNCHDKHWIPMSRWIDPRFIPTLNFVGHLETVQTDARALLEHVGAWEEFGAFGWGPHGDEAMFESMDPLADWTASDYAGSWHLMSKLFTPSIESILELYYREDYNTHEFDLPLIKIPFPTEIASKEVHIIMHERDGSAEHEKNSSLAEIETCDIDLNHTNKNKGDMDYGLPGGSMAGRLFDEGHVLGLLVHLHVGLAWM
jgi:Sulfotransferase family